MALNSGDSMAEANSAHVEISAGPSKPQYFLHFTYDGSPWSRPLCMFRAPKSKAMECTAPEKLDRNEGYFILR